VAEERISIDDVAAAVGALADDAAASVAPWLTEIARDEDKRSARLIRAGDRLRSLLGEEHPRVVAVSTEAKLADVSRRALETIATRIERRRPLKEHEWAVFGQVRDAAGESVEGVHVRVFDRDRKYDDLLGDETTDEFGDFSAVYHQRDFEEVGESLPELYIMVEDDKGNLLYSSEDELRVQPGRAEYFDIFLEALPKKRKPRRQTPRKQSRTRKSES
jgi:hypothetical protein